MEYQLEQNAEIQEQFRKKCLIDSGISYSIAAILPVILSLIVGFIAFGISGEHYAEKDYYLYLAYLVSQLSFAFVAFLYFLRSKENPKALTKGCKWYYFPIAILLQFGLLFSLSFVNDLFISLFEFFGYQASGTPLPSIDGWKLLPALFVIALLPAIFEEVLFRGLLSRNMHARGWGLIPTVVISGAIFSLFHGSPEQTVYQFICGVCFSLVAIRAGSILPTVVAHFLNNGTILLLAFQGIDDLSVLSKGGYIALMVTSAICLIGALVFLIGFDKNGNQKGGVKDAKAFFLAAAVGLAVCAVEWIFAFVTGF